MGWNLNINPIFKSDEEANQFFQSLDKCIGDFEKFMNSLSDDERERYKQLLEKGASNGHRLYGKDAEEFRKFHDDFNKSIESNNTQQEQKFSQNRFLKNDNDPFTKMAMKRMINAPKQQEPIKINTNINGEGIFMDSLFKTTNHTDEQTSNNYDQNNQMGV